jgi:hypothetical protein
MIASDALILWLANGERGISSNTMVTHLTGINAVGDSSPSHPRDPADLRRCRLLMERVPEIAERFPRMASHSLEWAALVARWDALCRMMDEEAPKWRDGTGSASHTYALMSEVIRGARSRESGR